MFSCSSKLLNLTLGVGVSLLMSCSNTGSRKDVNYIPSERSNGIVHETNKRTTKNGSSADGVISQGGTDGTGSSGSQSGTDVAVGDVDAENAALLNHCINSAETELGLLPLIQANCSVCHTTGPGSAYFVTDNPQATCDRLLGGVQEDGRYNVVDNAGRIFLTLPGESRLVSKLLGEHNCWTESCEDDAAQLTAEIAKWAEDTAGLRERIAASSGGLSSPPVGLLDLTEAPEEEGRVNFVKVEAEDPGVTRVGVWTDGTLNDGGATLYSELANGQGCGTPNNGGSYAGNMAASSLSFQMTVKQPGNYFVYLSSASNMGNADSFYVGINGAPSLDNGNPDADAAHQVNMSGDVSESLLARLSFGNNMNDLVNPLMGLAAGETVNVQVACRESNTRLDYVMLCQSDDPASCVVPENETEYYTPNIDISEFCGMPAAMRFRFFTSASDGSYVLKKPQIVDPSSTGNNTVPLSTALQISNLSVGVHDGTNAIFDSTVRGFSDEVYTTVAGDAAPFAENGIILKPINRIVLDKIAVKLDCSAM